MIHYHGGPITPDVAAVAAWQAGHAFISWERPDQLALAAEVCQSLALDNGAFSSWSSGKPTQDWTEFYEWAEAGRRIPSCDFAVIPDVIDGTEEENDALVRACPLPRWFAAPVWHLHESLLRLQMLACEFPRICLGSSGQYRTPGSAEWNTRMIDVMRAVCDHSGRPLVRIHGLRMLNPKIFTRFPFASVDSTNIARNVGIDKNWSKGNYLPPTKPARACVMRARIESENAPTHWIDK